MEMKTIAMTFRENLMRKVEESFEERKMVLEDLIFSFYENMDALTTYSTYLSKEQKNSFETLIYLEMVTYYTDLYLIINQHQKELCLRKEEYPILDLLSSIETYDDLVATVSSDPSFLEEMMKASLEVQELSFLGKVNLYYKLEQEDIDTLLKINPVFIEEIDMYSREIEPVDYIEHFEIELEKCTTYDVFPNLDGGHILTELCGFIKNLSVIHYENYINNIKDMAIFHYECIKYLKDFHYESSMYTEEEMKSMISYFENVSILELAVDILHKENYDYLRTIVEFYVQVYPNQKLFDNEGHEISYKDVCRYIGTNEKAKEKTKEKGNRI